METIIIYLVPVLNGFQTDRSRLVSTSLTLTILYSSEQGSSFQNVLIKPYCTLPVDGKKFDVCFPFFVF